MGQPWGSLTSEMLCGITLFSACMKYYPTKHSSMIPGRAAVRAVDFRAEEGGLADDRQFPGTCCLESQGHTKLTVKSFVVCPPLLK